MNFGKCIILIAFLTIIGCKTQESGGDFSREGVFFSYPSGWRISEQEDFDGGFYLSVEKAGFDQSALFMLTSIKGNVGLENYLQTLKDGYANQKLLKNMEFGNIKNDVFNGIESISCVFTFSSLGVNHTGKFYVFGNENYTYAIIKQEAVEDQNKNEDGFDKIEASFTIE